MEMAARVCATLRSQGLHVHPVVNTFRRRIPSTPPPVRSSIPGCALTALDIRGSPSAERTNSLRTRASHKVSRPASTSNSGRRSIPVVSRAQAAAQGELAMMLKEATMRCSSAVVVMAGSNHSATKGSGMFPTICLPPCALPGSAVKRVLPAAISRFFLPGKSRRRRIAWVWSALYATNVEDTRPLCAG